MSRLRTMAGDGIEKDMIEVPMVVGVDGVARGSAVVEGDGTGTALPVIDRSVVEPPATVVELPEAADEEPAAVAPSLAGCYRVIHGSLTMGSQDIAPCGSIVHLSDEDARAALAAKTVERV